MDVDHIEALSVEAMLNHVETFSFGDFNADALLRLVELCDVDMLQKLSMLSRPLSEMIIPILLKRLGFPFHEAARIDETVIETVEKAKALCIWRRHSSFRPASRYCIKFRDQKIFLTIDYLISYFKTEGLFSNVSDPCTMFMHHSSSCNPIDVHRFVAGIGSLQWKTFIVEGSIRYGVARQVEQSKFIADVPEKTYGSLETLDIYTPLLFLSPFRDWTTRMLASASKVRYLSLQHTDLTNRQWSVLLPLLDFPFLQRLSVAGEIALVSLVKFLSRHDSLVTLDVPDITLKCAHPNVQKSPSASHPNAQKASPTSKAIILPQLRFITAPAPFLTYILRHLAYPETVLSVAILPWSPSFDTKELKGLDMLHILGFLGRFSHVTTLSIRFPRDVKSNGNGIFDVLYPTYRVERRLKSIKTLNFTLCGIQTYFSEEFLNSSLDWISLFPSVKSVSVHSVPQPFRSRWERALKRRCPDLQRISLYPSPIA